jgi:hypothetical protein
LFVCNDDGIVVLSFDELKNILNKVETTAAVSVARERRKMYAVKGSCGELFYKIGRNDFEKLFSYRTENFDSTLSSVLKRKLKLLIKKGKLRFFQNS